jgi:hypothetical protein
MTNALGPPAILGSGVAVRRGHPHISFASYSAYLLASRRLRIPAESGEGRDALACRPIESAETNLGIVRTVVGRAEYPRP